MMLLGFLLEEYSTLDFFRANVTLIVSSLRTNCPGGGRTSFATFNFSIGSSYYRQGRVGNIMYGKIYCRKAVSCFQECLSVS
jgi:hypothetical protein